MLENPHSFGGGFKSFDTEKLRKHYFDTDIVTKVFVYDNIVVGAISEYHNKNRDVTELGYLFRLQVVRNSTIGRRLLRNAIQDAIVQDTSLIILDVFSNNSARRLYEYTGFETPTTPPMHSGRGKAVQMRLRNRHYQRAVEVLTEDYIC